MMPLPPCITRGSPAISKNLSQLLRTLEKSIQLGTDWHPSNVPFVSNPVSLVLFQCPYQQVSFELTDWLPKDDQLFTS